mmetsp:Transcript_10082/g.24473  ORF Transcript_10082/g.24473 Transcript_10082/m.24473 type:complete len:100 (-) Transcript_10082:115-414(-)
MEPPSSVGMVGATKKEQRCQGGSGNFSIESSTVEAWSSSFVFFACTTADVASIAIAAVDTKSKRGKLERNSSSGHLRFLSDMTITGEQLFGRLGTLHCL